MRHNIIIFMAGHFIAFIRQHIATSIFFTVFAIAPLLTFSAYNSYAFDNTTIIRDTQLLLSLHGFYTGSIDGQCNPQTKQAIATYQKHYSKMPPSEPNDIECNIDLLNTIKTDIGNALTRPSVATTNINEIAEIKENIKNTNAALKGLTDGFTSNFLSQYHSLASSGISAFIAAISLTIAIIALASALLKDFIKEHINSHTEGVISKASTHLLHEANIAHKSLAVQIYARIGGNILYSQLKSFYNDRDCPQTRRKDRYFGYLEGGTHISTIGNDTANDLIMLYDKKELTDIDYKWINACRNNFIFYICSENDVYFNTQRTEEAIKTLGDVAKAITELEIMLSDGRKKDHLRDNKETLIWAKLCLGTLSGRDAKTQIGKLAEETDTPVKWKRDIQARYKFYDRFPEHRQNQVDLEIA